jgi:hypothetical protein
MPTREYFDSMGQSIVNTSRNRIRAQQNPTKQARVPYQPEINTGRGGSPLHPQSNTGRNGGGRPRRLRPRRRGSSGAAVSGCGWMACSGVPGGWGRRRVRRRAARALAKQRGRRCEVETELCACLEVYRGPGQPWADALGVGRSQPDTNRPYRPSEWPRCMLRPKWTTKWAHIGPSQSYLTRKKLIHATKQKRLCFKKKAKASM